MLFRSAVTYIMEEFVKGTIQTFDGLTDRNGDIVFCTSHIYNDGVMEVVNHDLDLYYYSLREIPEKLIEFGTKIIDVFGIKERFFHLEFFETGKQQFVALEVNMRPPGGWTMDMFDYAADLDLYREWANLVTGQPLTIKEYQRKYHTGYVGRKGHKAYRHNHAEIMQRYGHLVAHYSEMQGIFGEVMGNFGYIVRSPHLNELFEAIRFMHEK